MIDEEATRVRFGYTSDELSKSSHKKIVRLCDNCGRERELEFRSYKNLCQNCGQLKRYEDPEEHKKSSKAQKQKHIDDPTIIQRQRDSAKKVHREHPENYIEANKNMSKILLETHKNNPDIDKRISESHKRRYDEANGNPIEMHHIIYDDNDKNKFRIPLRMTAHHKIHEAFKRSGFKIPHINGRGAL